MGWILFTLAFFGITAAAVAFLFGYIKIERLLAVVRPARGYDLSAARLQRTSAHVVTDVTQESGQVEVNGELWEARAAHPADDFPVGSIVMVVGVRGTCLIVAPSPSKEAMWFQP